MITKGLVGVLHNSWTLALLMLLPLLCRLLESDGASRVSSCMCEKLCRWHLSGTGAWWLLVLYWLTSNEFNLYFFLFVILENTSPEQTYFRGGSQITTSGADALRRGTFSGVCGRFSRSSLLFPVLPISSVTHDGILYIVLTQLAERSK